MADKTSKWWDKSITLVEGCKPVSPGCAHCWSAAMTHRFHQNKGLTTNGHFNGKIICREDRLNEILKRKKPTRWTIWNDLFNEKVPFEFIDKVMQIISTYPQQHTFLILTKRPKIMADYFKQLYVGLSRFHKGKDFQWPFKNVHLGVTICTQKEADEILPIALRIPGFDFVSAEPLLEEIDFQPYCDDISWFVLGCESGSKRRSISLEDFYHTLCSIDAPAAKVFVKQMEIDGKVEHAIEKFPAWAQVRERI